MFVKLINFFSTPLPHISLKKILNQQFNMGLIYTQCNTTYEKKITYQMNRKKNSNFFVTKCIFNSILQFILFKTIEKNNFVKGVVLRITLLHQNSQYIVNPVGIYILVILIPVLNCLFPRSYFIRHGTNRNRLIFLKLLFGTTSFFLQNYKYCGINHFDTYWKTKIFLNLF